MCENERLRVFLFSTTQHETCVFNLMPSVRAGDKSVFFSTFIGEGPVWNTESLSSFPVGLYVQNSDPHLEKHLLQNICSVLRRRQVMTLDPDVAEPSCVVVFQRTVPKY